MNHTPAPLKRRLTALLYESLLVGAVTMLAGALAGGCTTLMQQFAPALLPVSSWLTVGLLLGAWWLYFRLNWVREKQTLPMRVWHIGLADSKSSLHPAPRQLLYRFLWACVFIVFVPLLVYAACRHFGLTQKNAGCLALFWWILPWGFALFHPRRQFLYDYLAGTELIDLREQKKYSELKSQ